VAEVENLSHFSKSPTGTGSDDIDDSDVENDELSNPRAVNPKPKCYYVVSFNTAGNSTGTSKSNSVTYRYYVGQLLETGTDAARNQFNFKFMRYSRKVANQFVWPNAQDEALVSLEDIKCELSPQSVAGVGS
jgi:hypothetical protein